MGLGCLGLRGHCYLAGGLRSWKPTPNVFSFKEKADLAGRSPVCTGPSHPPLSSSGGPHLGPSSETAQNALVGAAFCKGKLGSGTNLSPNAACLRIAALASFSPSPRLPLGPRRFWAASGSVGTAAWLVVSAAGNQLQTSSPSRRRLIWPEEALCALALATHP